MNDLFICNCNFKYKCVYIKRIILLLYVCIQQYSNNWVKCNIIFPRDGNLQKILSIYIYINQFIYYMRYKIEINLYYNIIWRKKIKEYLILKLHLFRLVEIEWNFYYSTIFSFVLWLCVCVFLYLYGCRFIYGKDSI